MRDESFVQLRLLHSIRQAIQIRLLNRQILRSKAAGPFYARIYLPKRVRCASRSLIDSYYSPFRTVVCRFQ